MKERNPGAIGYFDRKIDKFDNIYRQDGSRLGDWLNRTLRASVVERFKLTFEELPKMENMSVLDVGCGTGRYMFEAANRGASRIVGLDAAAGAIDAARIMASELGVEERVQFHQADFIDFQLSRHFDVVFAMGYFDYILNPESHLKKMLEICDGTLIASFPKFWHPMTPIRKIRLALNRCPVRFYSMPRIRNLLRTVACDNYQIKSVSRDFILIVRREEVLRSK